MNLFLWICMKDFHFTIFEYPRGVLFSKSIMSFTGVLGWNYCHFGGVCAVHNFLILLLDGALVQNEA